MYLKVILCGSIVLALFVLNVMSTGHGGSQGPIIIRSTGRKGRNSDMFFIGGETKCGQGPIIAKSGGRKRRYGNDMIMLGGTQCKESKKKEIIPVPYPVKQMVHVPVPYKETVHVPVHIPVHIPVAVKEEYGSMGGYGGGGDMGGYGGGMEMGGYGGGY